MLNRVFSVVMFILLVTGMLTLAFKVQPVRAQGTIHINADGSISPSTAPISTVDDITYTFTGDVNDSIVVERDNIVVDGAGHAMQGTGSGNGITLSGRSNVTIENMEITTFSVGIWLDSSSNIDISGNNITANNGYYGGIYLGSSSNNSISGNSITANNGFGITLYVSSSYNSISGNSITASTYDGIWLYYSSDISISGNNVTNNRSGIVLGYSSGDIISGNNIRSQYYDGIELWVSYYNSIHENTITNNNWIGINSYGSSNNSISVNNITASGMKNIWLDSSSNYNSICVNNITASLQLGISLDSSLGNSIFHNNFINNTQQVNSTDSLNVWDDGYPSGGNYWSNYTGVDLYRGPYQNITGSDGIGDTPYIIDANNTDNYPLMTLWSPHDVVVTYVSSSKTVVVQGMSDAINVTVTNQGNYTETFNVLIFANASFIAAQNVTLTSGNSTTINFTWNTTGFAYGNYTLSALAWAVPGETNTANNFLTDGPVYVGIPGDINVDGIVDIYDAIKLAGAYNSKPGDQNWNLNADINGDNIVDIYDAIILATHYGQHYP